MRRSRIDGPAPMTVFRWAGLRVESGPMDNQSPQNASINPPVLRYQRPQRARRNTSGPVALGVCLLLVAAVMVAAGARYLIAAGDVAALMTMPLLFGVLPGILLVGGAGGLLMRLPIARKVLLAWVRLEASLSLGAVFVFWFLNRFSLAIVVMLLVRLMVPVLTRVWLGVPQAAEWFGDRPGDGVGDAAAAAGKMPGAAIPVGARFRVRGIDARSRDETEFFSRAVSAELAEKSGIAMGLIPESVRVESIGAQAK